MPAGIVSGEAWANTRKLIADRYHLETVVSSQDPERQNFSENTDISEVLFIARKRTDDEPASDQRTVYINLNRNPRSIHESIDLAYRLAQIQNPATIESEGMSSVSGPNGKLGEVISLPIAEGEQNWYGALFAQTELIRIYRMLEENQLRIPGKKQTVSLPFCRLDSLGALGPDRKRISEGFETTEDDWTPYPGFWGHKSARDRTIKQQPNTHLSVWLESPRGPDYGPHLWERAGRILLVERMRLNTHRVIAIGFDEEVLGNVWWALKPDGLNQRQEKALLLWLNSSLSILLFFGRRVVTQGPWTQMKQPAWQSMPVLDVRSLSGTQLKQFEQIYDGLSTKNLEPVAKLKSDEIRGEIDLAVSTILGIPEFAFIRDLLDREPGMTAIELSPRTPAEDGDDEEVEDAEQPDLL